MSGVEITKNNVMTGKSQVPFPAE